MRRPSTSSTLALLLPVLGACAAQKGQERLDPLGLVPSPPTISAAAAAAHVGELVVVQTKITAARVERGQAILEPEGVPPGGLVIAIAPPVVGPSARELAGKYDGQEVRAVGYISDLGNDLELLVGDPARIRLADDGAPDEEVPAADAAVGLEPAAPPKRAARTAAVAAAAPVGADAEPAVAAAPSPRRTPDPACENARRAWRIAAMDARAPLRELLGCLEQGEPRCTDAAGRARVALAEVAASEERLRWVCGGGS